MSIKNAIKEANNILEQLDLSGADTKQKIYIEQEVSVALGTVIVADPFRFVTITENEQGHLVCSCYGYAVAEEHRYHHPMIAGQVVCRHVVAEMLGDIAWHETKEIEL